MEYRHFGKTGLTVSVMGFGAGHIGRKETGDSDVKRLLHTALDSGINLFDTARSYGISEERIGRFLKGKRNQVILSTKVGYTYRNTTDWSFEATLGGIEESLQRLQTDHIEIVHLHSCPREVLEQGDAILALEKAKEQGKIGVIAYSGENEALEYAIRCGMFGSIQCSVNIFDQAGLTRHLPEANRMGLGIIAKRPLGNAVWRYHARPDGHGHALYYDRFRLMRPLVGDIHPAELAIRFAAYAPYVSCIIVGTANPGHLTGNLEWIRQGPLPESMKSELSDSFSRLGTEPAGLV